MAKFKVLKTFKDKHTKEVYKKTAYRHRSKRADEVAKTLRLFFRAY